MSLTKRDERRILEGELEEALKRPPSFARSRLVLALTKAIDGLRPKRRERKWKVPSLT